MHVYKPPPVGGLDRVPVFTAGTGSTRADLFELDGVTPMPGNVLVADTSGNLPSFQCATSPVFVGASGSRTTWQPSESGTPSPAASGVVGIGDWAHWHHAGVPAAGTPIDLAADLLGSSGSTIVVETGAAATAFGHDLIKVTEAGAYTFFANVQAEGVFEYGILGAWSADAPYANVEPLATYSAWLVMGDTASANNGLAGSLTVWLPANTVVDFYSLGAGSSGGFIELTVQRVGGDAPNP